MDSAASPSPWTVALRASPGARVRLVCFPYAGGSAVAFRAWPARLPHDVEVIAVEYPGRGRRFQEPPLPTADALVRGLLASAAPVFRAPVVLYGHSMGALVAFETARALERSGTLAAPAGLIVSGQVAPARRRRGVARHALPHDAFVAELRRLGGTPPEVFAAPDLLQLLTPMLRADFNVCDAYEPPIDTTPLRCPVVACGGSADPEVPVEDLAHWRGTTTGTFASHVFPGDHFFIRSAEAAFLGCVSAELARLADAR